MAKTTKRKVQKAGKTRTRRAGPSRGSSVGKPGTNFKQVTPGNRKKINPIVRHYMKSATPFRSCVRDNRKRFGANAERVCAVVKDMGRGTTKWRKGRKKK